MYQPSDRNLQVLHSPPFKTAPFSTAPPTHLPIGFLFWFHILLLVILALVAVISRYNNLSSYNYYYYSSVYEFFVQ